jgi:hypothetical protein
LTCLANGWPADDYRVADHPLQRRITAEIEELTGENVAATGVDGCGAPVVAVSLRAVAVAYLRLVSAEPGTAERRVADAMRAHPDWWRHHGRRHRLMRGFPDCCPNGAEGVSGRGARRWRGRGQDRRTGDGGPDPVHGVARCAGSACAGGPRRYAEVPVSARATIGSIRSAWLTVLRRVVLTRRENRVRSNGHVPRTHANWS